MAARIAAAVILAGCLLGCSDKAAPSGDPVELLTGTMPFDADECTDGGALAVLIVDSKYGTALDREYGTSPTGPVPVMWPPGFTGRRVGGAVVVVDPKGRAVAETGQSYLFSGNVLIRAPVGGWPNREDRKYRRGWVNSLIGPDMFYACGAATPAPLQTPFPMI